jgi:hypothetical protein
VVIVDPKIRPFYDVTFDLGALVFCEDCEREIEYSSSHPRFTDENYYDAAIAMNAAGWMVSPGTIDAFCPTCAAKRGLRPTTWTTPI